MNEHIEEFETAHPDFVINYYDDGSWAPYLDANEADHASFASTILVGVTTIYRVRVWVN